MQRRAAARTLAGTRGGSLLHQRIVSWHGAARTAAPKVEIAAPCAKIVSASTPGGRPGSAIVALKAPEPFAGPCATSSGGIATQIVPASEAWNRDAGASE